MPEEGLKPDAPEFIFSTEAAARLTAIRRAAQAWYLRIGVLPFGAEHEIGEALQNLQRLLNMRKRAFWYCRKCGTMLKPHGERQCKCRNEP